MADHPWSWSAAEPRDFYVSITGPTKNPSSHVVRVRRVGAVVRRSTLSCFCATQRKSIPCGFDAVLCMLKNMHGSEESERMRASRGGPRPPRGCVGGGERTAGQGMQFTAEYKWLRGPSVLSCSLAPRKMASAAEPLTCDELRAWMETHGVVDIPTSNTYCLAAFASHDVAFDTRGVTQYEP